MKQELRINIRDMTDLVATTGLYARKFIFDILCHIRAMKLGVDKTSRALGQASQRIRKKQREKSNSPSLCVFRSDSTDINSM